MGLTMEAKLKALGVTRHIHTHKYEAHVWHPVAHRRTGAQVYVGSFSTFDEAVYARDVAAIALKGITNAKLNRSAHLYTAENLFIKVTGVNECLRLLKNQTYLSKLSEFDTESASLCCRDSRVEELELISQE